MTQEKGEITLEEKSEEVKQKIINETAQNKRVEEILNIFPGAKIEDVKDKGEEDE